MAIIRDNNTTGAYSAIHKLVVAFIGRNQIKTIIYFCLFKIRVSKDEFQNTFCDQTVSFQFQYFSIFQQDVGGDTYLNFSRYYRIKYPSESGFFTNDR